jgi:hypothetical protein
MLKVSQIRIVQPGQRLPTLASNQAPGTVISAAMMEAPKVPQMAGALFVFVAAGEPLVGRVLQGRITKEPNGESAQA